MISLCAAALLMAAPAQAQSLKDLFNKENVKKVVSTVTGQTEEVKLIGTWTYKGAAIEFESDNLLAKAGGSVAATTAEKKLDEQLKKLGIHSGQMSFTFKEDSTFVTQVGSKNLKGTYSYQADSKTMKLKFAKLVPMNASVKYTATQTDLLFNIDKLLDLAKILASKSSNTTLKSISSLAENYDGMRGGFSLEKK